MRAIETPSFSAGVARIIFYLIIFAKGKLAIALNVWFLLVSPTYDRGLKLIIASPLSNGTFWA